MPVLRCQFCLLSEQEISPFLSQLKEEFPEVQMEWKASLATLSVSFSGTADVEKAASKLREKFSTFSVGEVSVDEATHLSCLRRKIKLGLAESCTGGSLAAHLTRFPGSSEYLLGSLVVYCNAWKERFLQVSRSTLQHPGPVSRKTVEEMIEGIFQETDAEFAVAVSGILGPGGGSDAIPVGTVYVAVAQKNHRIDVGKLQAPLDRDTARDWTVQMALGALFRRVEHGVYTFS